MRLPRSTVCTAHGSMPKRLPKPGVVLLVIEARSNSFAGLRYAAHLGAKNMETSMEWVSRFL